GITDGVYPAEPEQIAPILDATGTLEVLVEDLRTLALSETGSLTLKREPTDLAVLVNETLSSFSGAAEAAGVKLAEDVAGRRSPRRDRPSTDWRCARKPAEQRNPPYPSGWIGDRPGTSFRRRSYGHGRGHRRGHSRPAPAQGLRQVRQGAWLRRDRPGP